MHTTPRGLYRTSVALLVSALLLACQPEHGGDDLRQAQHPAAERPVIDALDKQTADARKARVSAIEYDISIDLAGDARQFAGELNVRFTLSDAASDLSLDFGGGSILNVTLNGSPVDTRYNGYFLSLPAANLHSGPNSATIRFAHAYSEDGTGLHRFVDPTDGLTYLYTYLWPYYANRLFPSFDQPNLKARFALSVRAPQDWIVVSATHGTADPSAADGTALWRFPATPPMSSYAFSLHAGPYHVWESAADGIPIRLMARRSLAQFVVAEEWLEVTRRGLDYYSDYFGIPYPFAKYDQLLVPDFMISGMENVAAVTFAEHFVQRQASDRSQRESRASVILHEMAHMWFGDLVTHDWWNGLWLNESFATQMAAMAEGRTTEFSDTGHGFFTDQKLHAYQADSRVSTHPIEMPVQSTADFFSVFDAITYDKGSSVLKQLEHYVGADNYRRGVSAYLKAHAYGTTQLEDFIGAQAQASGKDLSRWSQDWLYQAGFNTLSATSQCKDGRLSALTIRQSAPPEHPTLRLHQVDVALYALDQNGALLPATVIAVTVDGSETQVKPIPEAPCPVLINPNHQDWTLAQIDLDDRSLATLDTRLADVAEPLARSMFLAALFNRAKNGSSTLAHYLERALQLAEHEENIRIQQQISASLVTTVDLMQRLRPETDQALATWQPLLEQTSMQQAANAATSDLKRSWFNTFLDLAATRAGLDTMHGLLQGTRQIPGLPIAADLRWSLLENLARAGEPDIDVLIKAELARDHSDFAAKSALSANAARPDKVSKQRWLAELQHPDRLNGLARQRAVMSGLFPSSQTQLQFELLDEVLQSLPAISRTADPYFTSSYVKQLLPPICLPESVVKLQRALADYADELDVTALRFLREAHQADAECLALRAVQG